MKVLIISYYWPPAGGSGVQRWLKFVKYFQDFGVEPLVYCPENPSYPISDTSLIKEVPENLKVYRREILELGKKNKNTVQAGFISENPNWKERLALFIRANVFIPDARMFWIKPSINYLEKIIKKEAIDVVISTGPPHSMHLIAQGLKERTGVKWLADFRDPWTDIDYFHHLPFMSWARNKHFSLEKKALKTADLVTVVSEQMRRNYLKFNPNTHLVYNGYDGGLATISSLDTSFSMAHIGLLNGDRNPKSLWKALLELCQETPGFKEDLILKFVGKVAPEVMESLEVYGLNSNCEFIDYVPNSEVAKFQESSQVLLLLLNDVPASKGIVTGKVFEYFRAQRPILAVGPQEGDLDLLLQETRAGELYDFSDVIGLKKEIGKLYESYKQQNLKVESSKITKFHRKELTRQMATLLKSLK